LLEGAQGNALQFVDGSTAGRGLKELIDFEQYDRSPANVRNTKDEGRWVKASGDQGTTGRSIMVGKHAVSGKGEVTGNHAIGCLAPEN
jgi:hypothetical protein